MRGSKCQSTDLVPLRGKKLFGPRPQHIILVPFRGSFQISDDHPHHFYMGTTPGGCLIGAYKMLSLNESSVRAGWVIKVLCYQHQPLFRFIVWIRKITPVHSLTKSQSNSHTKFLVRLCSIAELNRTQSFD